MGLDSPRFSAYDMRMQAAWQKFRGCEIDYRKGLTFKNQQIFEI